MNTFLVPRRFCAKCVDEALDDGVGEIIESRGESERCVWVGRKIWHVSFHLEGCALANYNVDR